MHSCSSVALPTSAPGTAKRRSAGSRCMLAPGRPATPDARQVGRKRSGHDTVLLSSALDQRAMRTLESGRHAGVLERDAGLASRRGEARCCRAKQGTPCAAHAAIDVEPLTTRAHAAQRTRVRRTLRGICACCCAIIGVT